MTLRRGLDDGRESETLIDTREKEGERAEWTEGTEWEVRVGKEVEDGGEGEEEYVSDVEEAIRPLPSESKGSF